MLSAVRLLFVHMSLADDVISQLDALVRQYAPKVEDGGMGYGPYLEGSPVEQSAACSRLSAAIDRYTQAGSPYREEAQRVHESGRASDSRAVQLLGVVQGLRDDYAAGQMRSVEELVHADLFADFLEMAKELLDKGFKDPAAVLAGSVLEGHLRQLALKAGVPVQTQESKPRKAEAINADLGKEVYGTGDQKSVTAWLDLRNNAAHGNYEKYDPTQVAILIESTRAFMARHPA